MTVSGWRDKRKYKDFIASVCGLIIHMMMMMMHIHAPPPHPLIGWFYN